MKIFKSLITIAAVAAIAVGATGAYFSDEVTSDGNTFAAGTLELNVDGARTNVVKFKAANLSPGKRPNNSYILANVGTTNGFIDIENIVITDTENGCNAVEVSAVDLTCATPGVGLGELSDVVELRLFWDNDGDGSFTSGTDVEVYSGLANAIAGNYETNKQVKAGKTAALKALLHWKSTPNDNLAQTDSMQLDMTFELAQKTTQ